MAIKRADIKTVEKSLERLPEEDSKALVPVTANLPVTAADPEYFRPTTRQRKLKSAFHMACKSLPKDATQVTKEFILQHIKSADLEIWWDIPGFRRWFQKEESVSSRLEHLYQLRLDAIEEVLSDETNVYTARDRIVAGEQLDKIARTLVDAADTLRKDKVDTRSYEEKVAEAMKKAREREDKEAKEKAERGVGVPKRDGNDKIVFPGEEDVDE